MGLGIASSTLLAQVENAAPFAFGGPAPYLKRLAAWRAAPPGRESPVDYYALCMAAHWATAGSYIPTDVDNAIREKLWVLSSDRNIRAAMADIVLEALGWDYGPVTAKLALSPSGARLSTHEGTWFSVAAGAYAAIRGEDPERAERLLGAMTAEIRREAAVLEELSESGRWLELAKAVALVAHNVGDLDRVIDQWGLPKNDPARLRLYKSAGPACGEHHPLFAFAAEFNTRHLAPENHRHFALRKPRALRRRAEYLLPVGPFYDIWGAYIGNLRLGHGLAPTEAGEIAAALIDGRERLPGTFGYARALSGLLETFPGGLEELSKTLTARDLRRLKSGELRAAISVPRERFEAQWVARTRVAFSCWRLTTT